MLVLENSTVSEPSSDPEDVELLVFSLFKFLFYVYGCFACMYVCVKCPQKP